MPVIRIQKPRASLVGSDGEDSAGSAGDLGSIPGSERSPGEGNGNPLQYFCLEDSMDRGAWWATVCGVAEYLKTRSRLSCPTVTKLALSGGSTRVLSQSFSTWARLAFRARRFFVAGMSCALRNGLVSFPGLSPLDTRSIPSPSYADQKCSRRCRVPWETRLRLAENPPGACVPSPTQGLPLPCCSVYDQDSTYVWVQR